PVRAVVAEDDSSEILAAIGQLVGAEVEDLPARHIRKENEVRDLRDLAPTINDHTISGGVGLEQRIQLSVLDNRKTYFGISAPVFCGNSLTADKSKASFPDIPSKIGAGRDQ